MYTDSQPLTERQRQRLAVMLYWALGEIRGLGGQGKSQQAADLADAFHNLPFYLWRDDFSLSFFRLFLEDYQQQYAGAIRWNYLRMLDELDSEEADWYSLSLHVGTKFC